MGEPLKWGVPPHSRPSEFFEPLGFKTLVELSGDELWSTFGFTQRARMAGLGLGAHFVVLEVVG